MAFIPAKCTQCGANITVDNTKEAGICEFCGTAFITEKAINNYTINNTYNIQNANIVMPQKNLENIKQLANEEYSNKRYKEADAYYRQVLEIDNTDYECSFRRFLCLTREKKDAYHNSYLSVMIERLEQYIKTVDEEQKIDITEKNEKINFACNECQDILMNNYCLGRDECLIDGKIRKPNDIYTISTICGNTYRAFFKLFDCIEPWLNKYDTVKQNWNLYVFYTQVVMELCCKRFTCVADNKIYGKSNSGAEDIYRDAKVLREYALKVNPEFTLSSQLTSPSEGGKGCANSGGCYIATCVYGSYDCPQVWTLRRFRDNTLDKFWGGKAFIRCYYAISPTLVKWFGDQKWFRNIWKSYLDIMVKMLNQKGVENTRYIDKY